MATVQKLVRAHVGFLHRSSKTYLSSANRLSYYYNTVRYCDTQAGTVLEDMSNVNSTKEPGFDQLLESSRFFASCGESPVGQRVVAKIIAERGNDLYVDFGGKFHAVVGRPKKNGRLYRKGKWVDVLLEDLEVTEHFQGLSRDTSLLEAQVKLLGLSDYRPISS